MKFQLKSLLKWIIRQRLKKYWKDAKVWFSMVHDNYKELANENFDYCTKKVLADLQSEGNSESEEGC